MLNQLHDVMIQYIF